MPVRRPLRQHLEGLLAALLAGTPSQVGDVSIQLETVYAYRLNPRLEPVVLPVFPTAPSGGQAPEVAGF